jgi:excisionase family DNA binding protein
MKKDAYTTYEVSKICHVTMKTIAEWVKTGKLIAQKTLGGHRRIKHADLIFFLKQNNIPIPDELEPAKPVRILVIDDEIHIINYIIRVFQTSYPDNSYMISSANDGFEAGKQILSFKPDLIMLDLHLPGIDGFKVCENIKSDPLTKHIKIVVVTGDNSEETHNRVIKLGADGYIKKPFQIETLLEEIKKLNILTGA